MLHNCKKLETVKLKLSLYNVINNAVVTIATNITSLQLQNDSNGSVVMTSTGLDAILSHCPKLTELMLFRVHFGNSMAKVIAERCGDRLQFLSISNSNLGSVLCYDDFFQSCCCLHLKYFVKSLTNCESFIMQS